MTNDNIKIGGRYRLDIPGTGFKGFGVVTKKENSRTLMEHFYRDSGKITPVNIAPDHAKYLTEVI